MLFADNIDFFHFFQDTNLYKGKEISHKVLRFTVLVILCKNKVLDLSANDLSAELVCVGYYPHS